MLLNQWNTLCSTDNIRRFTDHTTVVFWITTVQDNWHKLQIFPSPFFIPDVTTFCTQDW